MPFEVTLDGKTYSTGSLLLDECEQLEEETGRTWLELNPVRSSKEFRATAKVFLARDHGDADVARIIAAVTVDDAMAAVEWVDSDVPDMFEDGIPKAEGELSTITSSGSPSLPMAGRPMSPDANGSVTSNSSSQPANRKT